MLSINIQNDMTGTETSANYTYTVSVNNKIIETGEVKGHNRNNGFRALLNLICNTPLVYEDALPPAKDNVYKVEWIDGETVRLTPETAGIAEKDAPETLADMPRPWSTDEMDKS